MLLPDNIHPNMSLYYNGGFILKALTEITESDLMGLYLETKKLKDISMPIFVLSLDWLYIADLVEHNERGNIVPCS